MLAGPDTQVSRRRFICMLGATGALAAGKPSRCAVESFSRSAAALGAAVNITVLHSSRETARAALDAAMAEVRLVDELMSLYRADSQVSLLNRAGVLDDPHPCLVEILDIAREISRRTDGAFDITVQPLWQLYSAAAAARTVPDDRAVREAVRLVDWRSVDVTARRVVLRRPGSAITLNAIAQGYAADRAAAAMRKAGITMALVDTGEIAALGHKPDGSCWKIGIQHPRHRDACVAVASLADCCMATSGDYATSFTDDRLYHHIFDPLTGRSPRELASATVVAHSAAHADALATALMVMGAERGLALIRTLAGTEALLVKKSGQIVATSAFPA